MEKNKVVNIWLIYMIVTAESYWNMSPIRNLLSKFFRSAELGLNYYVLNSSDIPNLHQIIWNLTLQETMCLLNFLRSLKTQEKMPMKVSIKTFVLLLWTNAFGSHLCMPTFILGHLSKVVFPALYLLLSMSELTRVIGAVTVAVRMVPVDL